MTNAFDTKDIEKSIDDLTSKIRVTKKEIEKLKSDVDARNALDRENRSLMGEIAHLQESLVQSLENQRTRWENENAELVANSLKFDFINRMKE